MAYDHNDIYNIVERLAILEGRITPTTVKKGLNPQQKSVPQLPALFKPKHISVLTAKKDPQHPMHGYAVGASESQDKDEEMVEEAVTSEDVLSKVQKSFAEYLSNIADEIKQDTDLKDKKREDTDLKKKEKRDRDLIAKEAVSAPVEETQTSYPVKSITNECGLWEIHGNEPSGFEIRYGNRPMKSRFKTIEEAEMALEMFAARRRKQDDSADYIEEA